MKLNYKRTVLTGFAFFLISAFWQAYEATVPVTLTNKFGMSQTWSGIVMALDNILAVFLLPLFGALSDRCASRFGKRTPFITLGTVAAAVLLVGLTVADGMQLRNLSQAAAIDDPAALGVIYDSQGQTELLTPEGEEFVLSQVFTKEEFTAIVCKTVDPDTGKTQTNPDYTNYVSPARQAYAGEMTRQSPGAAVLFFGLLLLLLIAMASFRSPAVALMPDVTIKPLRSKANGVINLMGTAGGILVLVLGMIFSTSAVENALMRYTGYYAVVAAIMLLSLLIFLLTVREPAWAGEMQEQSLALGLEKPSDQGHKRGLTAAEKRSLLLILLSIGLWFFGYNAVTSKYAVYAGNILGKDYNTTMLLAQGAAVAAYLPAGAAASRIGRKKTILAGVGMLAAAFASAAFMRASSPDWAMNVIFLLAGVAWATINVNSFPMVVEMCAQGDVGRYTGFYYTASMTAQIVTPMLSGYLMDRLGMTVLFPYAAVFVSLALVTMLMVRHGDSRPVAKGGDDCA